MTDGSGLRSGLWLPLFDELADPLVVARLAAEAEEAGWDGVFTWDHLRWGEPVRQVLDPWITLTAVATATERVSLGPMVTPLPRRRPVKVARETATLDQLSRGRLVLGVGLGGDWYGELSKTGEEVDDRVRGQLLDESLEILAAAWSGEPVQYRGRHHVVDDMQFLPTPVQRPGVPVWVAGFPGNAKPLRRAARYQGVRPGQPRTPRSTRRGRRDDRRSARRPGGALRRRDRPAAGHRSGAVRRGRGDVVADRLRAPDPLGGPGPWRAARRPGTTVSA